MKNGQNFGTLLDFSFSKSYKGVLRTISSGRMVSCGKNETLFLKIEACIWSPEQF